MLWIVFDNSFSSSCVSVCVSLSIYFSIAFVGIVLKTLLKLDKEIPLNHFIVHSFILCEYSRWSTLYAKTNNNNNDDDSDNNDWNELVVSCQNLISFFILAHNSYCCMSFKSYMLFKMKNWVDIFRVIFQCKTKLRAHKVSNSRVWVAERKKQHKWNL